YLRLLGLAAREPDREYIENIQPQAENRFSQIARALVPPWPQPVRILLEKSQDRRRLLVISLGRTDCSDSRMRSSGPFACGQRRLGRVSTRYSLLEQRSITRLRG